MMYARRQVVNYDLLVVMNGHKALCLPLFAAAEACCSAISVCVCCPDNVYLSWGHGQKERGSPKHAIHWIYCRSTAVQRVETTLAQLVINSKIRLYRDWYFNSY